MKQLFRTLTIFVLPLLVAACNTDYNFDNISLEVTVGDTEGITVPLGTTGKISVGDLLKESGLETNEDGFYGFEYSDSFEYTAEVGTLAPITNLAPTIAPITENLFNGMDVNVGVFEGVKDLGFPSGLSGNYTITDQILELLPTTNFAMHYDPHTFEESFTIEVPDVVKSFEKITFGADGNGSVIDLQFDLGGLAGVNENCHIEKLYFELPAGFTIESLPNDPIGDYITISNGEGSTTPNRYEINKYDLTGSHLTVDIIIKSVELDHLTIGDDGKVTITEDVTFELDATISVKAGTISAESPSMTISATPIIYDATITTKEIAHAVEFQENIQEEIAIPDIVSRIDYLSIVSAEDPTQNPRFGVDVELAGSPVDMLELRDVEITLPSFLDIDAPEGWQYADGKLTTPRVEVHNNQVNHIIDLGLKGIESLDIVEGKVNLSSAVGISATAAIADGSSLHLSTSSQALTLTPTVRLDDMTIEQVTGVVDPDLSEMMPTQEILLGDLTASLEGIEMDLNIESPLLSVTVENPVGVGIDAQISLTAFKGEDMIQTVSAEVGILPAGDEPTITHILLAGDAMRAEGENVTVVEGLTELIAALPDKIVVDFAAETNKEQPHTLVLQDSYTFKVDYSVESAFKFDAEKNGTIDYTVLIEDVDLTSLADIDVIVENITVKMASESTLPIDMTMDIEFLDENDAPIECITSATEGKILGSTSQEATLSECDVVLTISTPSAESSSLSPFAEIARTKKVRCTLHGTTLAGGGLKPEQYISAKLSLLLEDGITVDLGSFLPEEEKPEPNEPNEPNEQPTE